MKRIIVIALLCMLCLPAASQRWMAGTNAADWAYFGTVNAEASVAVDRRVSVHASAKYNPWSWKKASGERINQKQQTYTLGFRYWPWNVYSGWWMGAGARVGEYNRGGLIKSETEEGDAAGVDFYAGYTLMLHKRFNLEIGWGMWAGKKRYISYDCPTCGHIIHDKEGSKAFLLPDNPTVNLVWIF